MPIGNSKWLPWPIMYSDWLIFQKYTEKPTGEDLIDVVEMFIRVITKLPNSDNPVLVSSYVVPIKEPRWQPWQLLT